MPKKRKSFIADKRKLNELIKVRKGRCAGCGIVFVEGNPIVANSSNSKRYHYNCAKCHRII